QAEDGIRDFHVTGVQTCALPIFGEQYAAASADLGRALDSLARLGTSLRAGSEEIDRLPGSVELATKRLQADRDNLRRTIEALLRSEERRVGKEWRSR